MKFLIVLFLSTTLARAAVMERCPLVQLDDLMADFSHPVELNPTQLALQRTVRESVRELQALSLRRFRRNRPDTSPRFRVLRESFLERSRRKKERIRTELAPLMARWLRETGNQFERQGNRLFFPPNLRGGPLNRYAAAIHERTGTTPVLDLEMEAGGYVNWDELTHRHNGISLGFALNLTAGATDGHELRHLAFLDMLEKGQTSLFQGRIHSSAEAAIPKSGYDDYVSFEELLTHAYTLKNRAQTLRMASARSRAQFRGYATRSARLSERIAGSAERALASLESSSDVELTQKPMLSRPLTVATLTVGGEKIEMLLPELTSTETAPEEVKELLRARLTKVAAVAREAATRYEALSDAVRAKARPTEIQARAERLDAYLAGYFHWDPRDQNRPR